MACGDPGITSVQRHRLPPPQELWPFQSLFLSLLSLAIRRPVCAVFLHSSAHSGTQSAPTSWGPPLQISVSVTKGAPGWGPALQFSESGVWWVGLSIVQLLMLSCLEREAVVVAAPPMCDSAVLPCFHGCLAFLHRHFPPQSPPSPPLSPSLHGQQRPSPWDFSTIPKLQLPAAAPSRGPASLSRLCTAAARTV